MPRFLRRLLAGVGLAILSAPAAPGPRAAEFATQLEDAPTAFLRRQADSPIHWQHWNPDILATADHANRLIIVLVGSSLYPDSDTALAALSNSPRTVADINENYLPVLLDADACREMAIFTAELSTEIKKSVGFPFLVWLSPGGNPVAWTPLNASEPKAMLALFKQSSAMVANMWKESPDYVRNNSARDAKLRHERLGAKRGNSHPDPAKQLETAVRDICGLYDPPSHSIDGTGGLPPAGIFELLARAATSPALPGPLRRACRSAVAGSVGSLVHSPMIDPLDGGIYLARRGMDWNLPVFSRDTATQCRMSIALVACWSATENPDFLAAATAALDFAEAGLGTGKSRIVHSAVLPKKNEPLVLWKTEDLKRELDPGEYRALAMAGELRGTGNIPFATDPDRNYFRLNVLGNRHSADEIAPKLGLSEAEASATLERAHQKLLEIRNRRLADRLVVESTAYARDHALLASANASAFAATGDPDRRRRAIGHLKTLRDDYFDADVGLRQFAKVSDPVLGAARGIDYALTIRACLDVHAATLDKSWLEWAEKLLLVVSEQFVVNGRLREFDSLSKVIDIPIGDAVMLFGESTCGVLQPAIERLSTFSYSAPAPLTEAIASELGATSPSPIIHTDLLLGTLARHPQTATK